jgi:curli biogenesis system outer membrane secretion channel CsgG
MKTFISALAVAVIAVVVFGCASETARPVAADDANPSRKVYTQQDIQASGRTQVGSALRQLDPDVRSNVNP